MSLDTKERHTIFLFILVMYRLLFSVCDEAFAGSESAFQIRMIDNKMMKSTNCVSPWLNSAHKKSYERGQKYETTFQCENQNDNYENPTFKRGNIKYLDIRNDGYDSFLGIGDDICIHDIAVYDEANEGLNNGLIFYKNNANLDIKNDKTYYRIRPEWFQRVGIGPIMRPGKPYTEIKPAIQEKVKEKWGLGCFKVGAGTGVYNKC